MMAHEGDKRGVYAQVITMRLEQQRQWWTAGHKQCSPAEIVIGKAKALSAPSTMQHHRHLVAAAECRTGTLTRATCA